MIKLWISWIIYVLWGRGIWGWEGVGECCGVPKAIQSLHSLLSNHHSTSLHPTSFHPTPLINHDISPTLHPQREWKLSMEIHNFCHLMCHVFPQHQKKRSWWLPITDWKTQGVHETAGLQSAMALKYGKLHMKGCPHNEPYLNNKNNNNKQY